ncbi:MAG: FAD-dependent oxidoreductase [Gaiellaceae bacterium]
MAIIGGGAVGAACALELARRGAAVTLLERGPELGSGCSAGNAGLICPSHSTPISNPAAVRNGLRWMLDRASPFYLKPRPAAVPWLARFLLAARRAPAGARAIRALSAASLELHAELARELDTGFERRGVLNAYVTEESYAAGRAEAQSSGLPFQALHCEEALALEPALGPRTLGAVYYPQEAHVDPLRCVRALGGAAAAEGADIRTRVEARRLRREGDRVAIETSDGVLRPQTVVLAAGAWSGALARSVHVYLPLEGGKGYHVDLEGAESDPRIPTWLQESWAIATPLPGRLRLAGTLELAGLDLSIDTRRAEAVRRGGARGLRGVEGRRVIDVWAGLRPCTPDGLPVIGSPKGLPGLVLATGHAMKGVSLAPVTGRLVAELVVGGSPSHDLRPFDPNRFRPVLPLG